MRRRGIPSLQVFREFLDFLAGRIGELLESRIAESCFAETQNPLGLFDIDAQRYLPILKSGIHIVLNQPCFAAPHEGTQVTRVAAQLFVKLPNGLVHFACTKKNFTHLSMQTGAIRRSRQSILKMNYSGGPLATRGITLCEQLFAAR